MTAYATLRTASCPGVGLCLMRGLSGSPVRARRYGLSVR